MSKECSCFTSLYQMENTVRQKHFHVLPCSLCKQVFIALHTLLGKYIKLKLNNPMPKNFPQIMVFHNRKVHASNHKFKLQPSWKGNILHSDILLALLIAISNATQWVDLENQIFELFKRFLDLPSISSSL